MADIQLRFGKDALVIGPHVHVQLANAVLIDDESERASTAFDTEFSLLFEPEIFDDAYLLQKLSGAQCLVTPTANLTPARLAHTGMEDASEQLAAAAVEAVAAQSPEHVLVDIGPCGLPLDAASKASLLENRRQYERAAQLFSNMEFDAFFLNGFTRVVDLKCALMGIRKVSDAPILASVNVDDQGMLCPNPDAVHPAKVCERLEEAVAVMEEYGAQVAGFAVHADVSVALNLVARMLDAVQLPLLVQLVAGQGVLGDPDDAFSAAEALVAAGVQFVRACGTATPAYTGAMVAAVSDMSVLDAFETPLPDEEIVNSLDDEGGLEALADRLRNRVNDALGIDSKGDR